jgi:hypothetical protein
VVNLNIFLPGQYFAEGSYGLESGLSLAFESNFAVEAFPEHLVVEGKARHRSSGTVYPFRVQLSRDKASQSQADASITIPGVPELKGRACLAGPTRELLANDPANQNQISARVVPLEAPRVYELSGILCLGGKAWFPFCFRAVPTEAEVALENVVAFPKRTA